MADRLCGRLQSGKGGFDSLSWLDHKRFNVTHHQIYNGVHKQCLIYLVCLAHMQMGISYMPRTVILFTYFAV